MNNLKEFSLILDERNEKLVVPTKWLSADNKILYWPPFHNRHEIKSAVIKKMEPDRSVWDEYSIGRLIKQYDEYVLAVSESKIVGIEDMTDVSDVEKQKHSRSSRLKRAPSPLPNQSKKIKTLSYSSDEDNEENFEPSKKKTETKERKTFSYSSDEDHVESTEASKKENATPRILENIPVQMNLFKSINASKSDQIMAQNQSKQTPCQIATETNAHEPNNYDSEKLIQNSENGCLRDLMLKMIAMIGNVLEKQISLNMKIEKLENKVDRQKQSSGASTSRTLTIDEIKELEGFFPMKNVEEVSEVETKLKSENKSFYRNLNHSWNQCCFSILVEAMKVLYVNKTGGSDYKKLTYNIMKTIMTDELAKTFSFTGRKGGSQSFSALIICNVVYQACQLSYTASDEDVKGAISAWLDAANTRLTRSLADGPKKKFKPMNIDLN